MVSREQVGVLAFYASLVVVLFLSLLPTGASAKTQVLVLGLLGVIVGWLNISDKELLTYMTASVALLLTAASLLPVLDDLPVVNLFFENLLRNTIILIAPGLAVVSLKLIYEASKSPESLPSVLQVTVQRRSASKAKKRRR